MNDTYQLAIVGFGPRGLFALEQFYLVAAQSNHQELPKTLIFEPNDELGVGKAWSVKQPDANWINIADRALDTFPARPAMHIAQMDIPEFPSYLKWLEEVMDHHVSDIKDTYHRRKVMGTYLNQRTHSLLERLETYGCVDIVNQEAVALSKKNQVFTLETAQKSYQAIKVVLALGHLPTAMSSQNQKFKKHAQEQDLHFSAHCYSQEALAFYAFAKAISIKGLGLSMIDVVRMVIAHYDGDFELIKGSYHLKYKAREEHPILIPFSLDGLPTVPKPFGHPMDVAYEMLTDRKQVLMEQLERLRDDEGTTVKQLVRAIAHEMIKIYSRLDLAHGNSRLDHELMVDLLTEWLMDPSTSHDLILDTSLPITDYIETTCAMAMGTAPPSLDYVAGQIWRQLQPDLYMVFSHKTAPSLMADFIKIDEQTKRYSYGPPVESMLQLLALHQAQILHLDVVNDPNIDLKKDGFKLSQNGSSHTANAMVDAIIPAPDVTEVKSPLIKNLLKDGFAQQVHEKLGFQVDQDATHLVHGRRIEGLYSFGRLAKGSVYGVDAILECFNEKKLKSWREQLSFDH
ncbi:FAD/NAD(P)-binding protein [Nonlabens xiamenensis]|uniref:FAD/NAD(P)-binding protein n=1 Tax=Nonlabens xiamenensis TaxID=2341043 RepID=UPI000F6053B8|nr:FAD/NAD(P)-binding domain-containing protein [Nonlabens xiamenensis]